MMASQVESLKSETVKPASNVINHPYSKRSKNPITSPDPEKSAEGHRKYPGLPYEKLLVIAELLK
ncbi:MAG: hypothetical protein ABRQ26_03445 [Syntrophomonadaceae bacterium]